MSWVSAKLEIYRVWITFLGLISGIITIGVFIVSLPWSGFVQAHLAALLALNTVITLVVIHWGAVQKSHRKKDQLAIRQEIYNLVDMIHDLSEFPYSDGRSFERQLPVYMRAAVAKNGKIPRDNRALVTRLNGMDMNLGARFEEIESNLKELELM